MRKMCVVLIALCLGGCAVVTAPHPVGEIPLKLGSSGWQEWTGTWVSSSGGAVQVEVKDEGTGSLRIAWIEKESGVFVLQTQDVLLRAAGNWIYASVKVTQDSAKSAYVWGRIERRDRVVLVWPPASDKFRQLVRDGKLPGTVSESTIALGSLGPRDLQLMHSEAEGILFEWDKPLIFWRASQ